MEDISRVVNVSTWWEIHVSIGWIWGLNAGDDDGGAKRVSAQNVHLSPFTVLLFTESSS